MKNKCHISLIPSFVKKSEHYRHAAPAANVSTKIEAYIRGLGRCIEGLFLIRAVRMGQRREQSRARLKVLPWTDLR